MEYLNKQQQEFLDSMKNSKMVNFHYQQLMLMIQSLSLNLIINMGVEKVQ